MSQGGLDPRRDRVRAAEHAPRNAFNVLERRHGLAEVVERGAFVMVNRPRVIPPHLERILMTLSEDAPRHRNYFAQQSLDFYIAL